MEIEYITPKILTIWATIIITVIFTILISEISNVSNNSLALSLIIKQVMEESCQFASQETYKIKRDDNDSVVRGNAYNILDKDGNFAVSGLFYDDDSYSEIMTGTDAQYYIDHLKDSLSTDAKRNNSFKILENIMDEHKRSINTSFSGYDITPLNLGFSYLHSDTLTKIFKWQLTNKLTSTGINNDDYRQRNTLLRDESGKLFIRWNGFRIYLDGLEVYTQADNRVQVLHITQDDDWKIFSDWTGITESYKDRLDPKDIRSYKVLYDIRWKIDIAYEGILPLFFILNIFQGDEAKTFSIAETSYEDQIRIRTIGDDEKSTLSGERDYNPVVWRATFGTDQTANPDGFDEQERTNNVVGSLFADNSQKIKLAQRTKFIVIH